MLGLISKVVRYCPVIFLGLRKRANGKVLFFFFQIDTPPKTYCARKRSGTLIAYHELASPQTSVGVRLLSRIHFSPV